jgi:hypothetical protein
MRKYLGLIIKMDYIPSVEALLLGNVETLALDESSEPIVKLEGKEETRY